jgi:hypothetical protein
MEISNITDILEMSVLVGEEDCPNIIDTTLMMYMIPYKCGYDDSEGVIADGKTPIMKKVKIYISIEDA